MTKPTPTPDTPTLKYIALGSDVRLGPEMIARARSVTVARRIALALNLMEARPRKGTKHA
jgi:hypothetical protein